MKLLPMIKRLSIRRKDLTVARFQPNWAQERLINEVETQINDGRPVRFIVLKARQIGISTAIEALIFTLSFAWDNTRGLVLAHKQDASQNILEMTNLYWKTFPFRDLYTTRYISRKELAWDETGSSIRIDTAGGGETGRSHTYNLVHASEVAFWPDAPKTMLALNQTVPYTPKSLLGLESTANGVGNYFYSQWKAAEGSEVEHVPLFFPWHQHPEYKASAAGLLYTPINNLDDEEVILRNMGISDDRLTWRRWAIKSLCGNDVKKFHQEYPTTPDEAFIATGTNVFPIGFLSKCYQPQPGRPGRIIRDDSSRGIKFVHDPTGPLRIFKAPSPHQWGEYFIGGDPTHTTRGDFAVAQVINRRTYEQVAVWRGRTDPIAFAKVLRDLGRFYNNATLAPEIEGPGYATIGALIESGYPNVWRKRGNDKLPGHVNDNYGWSSTYKTKQWMVGFLLKLIMDVEVTIHDRQTFVEARDYVTMDDGTYGPADGSDYDDTVSALAIACVCSASEGPISPFTDEPSYPGAVDSRPEGDNAAPWESWGEAG